MKDGRIPRAYYFDYDSARAKLEQLLNLRRGQMASASPRIDVDFESDEALRQLMEEFFRGFPNHVSNQAIWAVVRARFKSRGFDLPEHVKWDPLFPVLQAAYSAKLGRPVGCEQLYLIQLANTLFNSHKPALWVFSIMMSYYQRGSLLLSQGDRSAWKEKVWKYHQAWLDDVPEFRPDRRHSTLLAFLFPEAEEALREDPVAYVHRKRSRA